MPLWLDGHGGTAVFSYTIDGESELRLLEERHAEALFALTDQNRVYSLKYTRWVAR